MTSLFPSKKSQSTLADQCKKTLSSFTVAKQKRHFRMSKAEQKNEYTSNV